MLGKPDFVVADSQRAGAAKGFRMLRPFARAEEAGQVPPGVRSYAAHSPPPHRHRDLRRAGA